MSTKPLGYLQFLANGPSSPVPFPSQGLTVGRSPKADVTVRDAKASRQHCRLVADAAHDGTPSVEDLGSTGGTLVNGTRIAARQRLYPGDRIRIGTTEFVFVPDEATARALAAKFDDEEDEADFEPAGIASTPAKPVDPNTPYLEPMNVPPALGLPARMHLANPRTVLGRRSSNELVVPASSISGQHCEFIRQPDGSVRMRDLNSTNGVRVNGHKVSEAVLATGDVLSVERIALRYVDPRQPAPDPPPARLTALVGEWTAPIVVIGNAEVSIGRNKHANTHPLKDDTEASAMHVRIYRRDGRVVLEDVGSTNGTRVNGRKVVPNEAVPLGHGAKVKIGNTILRFDDPTAPAAEPEASDDSAEALDAASDEDRRATLHDGDAIVADDIFGATEELSLDDVASAPPEAKTKKAGKSAAADREMDAFLHSGRGRRRRTWMFRVAEGVLALGVVAVAATALFTGASQTTSDEVDTPSVISPPADSLIRTNWSFEQVGDAREARRVAGWDFVGARFDANYVDAADARTGVRAMTIVREANDFGSTDAYSVDVIPVEPGQILSASAFVRSVRGTRGGGGIRIVFFADEDATRPLASVASNYRRPAGWEQVVLDVSVPRGARSARVGLSVVGESQRISFDDVVARLDRSAAPVDPVLIAADDSTHTLDPVEVQAGDTRLGPFAWRLAPDGSFELVRYRANANGAEVATTVMRNADVVARRTRQGPFARLFDLSAWRRVAVIDGHMTVETELANPFARAGNDTTGLPPVAAVLRLGWDAAGEPLLSFHADGLADAAEVGLIADVPDAGLQRPVARFLEHEQRTSTLAFHGYPLRTAAGEPVRASRLALPLAVGGEFLHVGAREPAQATPFAAEAVARASAVELTLWRPGSRLEMPFALDPFVRETRAMRAEIEDARRRGDDAGALVGLLRMLERSLHRPEAIRQAEAEFAQIASPLEVRIQETQALLAALDRNFSRTQLEQAQDEAAALRRRLDPDVLMRAPRAFLSRYAPADDSSPIDYTRIFATMRDSLERLENWEEGFDAIRQRRRVEVDASLMARWEDQVAPLLARAIDFDNTGRRAMAFTLYRRVIREAPLSRPATRARHALVDVALEMLQEAAEAESRYPERALDLRHLARTFAKEVLALDWPQAAEAAAEPNAPMWDRAENDWPAGRVRQLVTHFAASATRADGAVMSQAEWLATERAARERAADILAATADLPQDVAEPTDPNDEDLPE